MSKSISKKEIAASLSDHSLAVMDKKRKPFKEADITDDMAAEFNKNMEVIFKEDPNFNIGVADDYNGKIDDDFLKMINDLCKKHMDYDLLGECLAADQGFTFFDLEKYVGFHTGNVYEATKVLSHISGYMNTYSRDFLLKEELGEIFEQFNIPLKTYADLHEYLSTKKKVYEGIVPGNYIIEEEKKRFKFSVEEVDDESDEIKATGEDGKPYNIKKDKMEQAMKDGSCKPYEGSITEGEITDDMLKSIESGETVALTGGLSYEGSKMSKNDKGSYEFLIPKDSITRYSSTEDMVNSINGDDTEVKARVFKYDEALTKELGQDTYIDDNGIKASSDDDNMLLESKEENDMTDEELIKAAEDIAKRVAPNGEEVALTEDDFLGELEKDGITGAHNEEGVKMHLAKMKIPVIVDELCQYKHQIHGMLNEMITKINEATKDTDKSKQITRVDLFNAIEKFGEVDDIDGVCDALIGDDDEDIVSIETIQFDLLEKLPNTGEKVLAHLEGKVDEAKNGVGGLAANDVSLAWGESYGESFKSEYPAVWKVLNSIPTFTRELVRKKWQDLYGEDFKSEYPAVWKMLDKPNKVGEAKNASFPDDEMEYAGDIDFEGVTVLDAKSKHGPNNEGTLKYEYDGKEYTMNLTVESTEKEEADITVKITSGDKSLIDVKLDKTNKADFFGGLDELNELVKKAADANVNESYAVGDQIYCPTDYGNKVLAGCNGYIVEIKDDVASINLDKDNTDPKKYITVPVKELPVKENINEGGPTKLIRGKDLTPEQKEKVLAAFIYRNTKEKPFSKSGGDGSKTDDEWVNAHSFAFTKNGELSNRKKYADPDYMAESAKRKRGVNESVDIDALVKSYNINTKPGVAGIKWLLQNYGDIRIEDIKENKSSVKKNINEDENAPTASAIKAKFRQLAKGYGIKMQPADEDELFNAVENGLRSKQSGSDGFDSSDEAYRQVFKSYFPDADDEKVNESAPKPIGKTKSGKYIYSKHTHPSHKKFTAADHLDARDLHHELANKASDDSKPKEYDFHSVQGDEHDVKANKSKMNESKYKVDDEIVDPAGDKCRVAAVGNWKDVEGYDDGAMEKMIRRGNAKEDDDFIVLSCDGSTQVWLKSDLGDNSISEAKVDDITTPQQLGTALKNFFKKKYNVTLKSTNYVKTVRGLEGSYYRISTFKGYNDGKRENTGVLPNEIRLQCAELVYGKEGDTIKNKEDVSLGNIHPDGISLLGKQWKQILKNNGYESMNETKELSDSELEAQTTPTHKVKTALKVDNVTLLYVGAEVHYDIPGGRLVITKGKNQGMIVDMDASEAEEYLEKIKPVKEAAHKVNIGFSQNGTITVGYEGGNYDFEFVEEDIEALKKHTTGVTLRHKSEYIPLTAEDVAKILALAEKNKDSLATASDYDNYEPLKFNESTDGDEIPAPKFQKYTDSKEGAFKVGDTVAVKWQGDVVDGEIIEHTPESTGQGKFRHTYFVKLPGVTEPQRFFQNAFLVENKVNEVGDDHVKIDPARAQKYLSDKESYFKLKYVGDEVMISAKPGHMDDEDYIDIAKFPYLFKYNKTTGEMRINPDVEKIPNKNLADKLDDEYNALIDASVALTNAKPIKTKTDESASGDHMEYEKLVLKALPDAENIFAKSDDSDGSGSVDFDYNGKEYTLSVSKTTGSDNDMSMPVGLFADGDNTNRTDVLKGDPSTFNHKLAEYLKKTIKAIETNETKVDEGGGAGVEFETEKADADFTEFNKTTKGFSLKGKLSGLYLASYENRKKTEGDNGELEIELTKDEVDSAMKSAGFDDIDGVDGVVSVNITDWGKLMYSRGFVRSLLDTGDIVTFPNCEVEVEVENGGETTTIELTVDIHLTISDQLALEYTTIDDNDEDDDYDPDDDTNESKKSKKANEDAGNEEISRQVGWRMLVTDLEKEIGSPVTEEDATAAIAHIKADAVIYFGGDIKVNMVSVDGFSGEGDNKMVSFIIDLEGPGTELDEKIKASKYEYEEENTDEGLILPKLNNSIMESLGISINEATDWASYVPKDVDGMASMLSAMNMTIDKADTDEFKKIVDEFNDKNDSEASLSDNVKKAGMEEATSLLRSVRKFKYDYTDDLWKNMESSVGEELVVEAKAVKTIIDKENDRKYDFYKTPSGALEYDLHEVDTDDSWFKQGTTETVKGNVQWLLDEENAEITAYLEKEGYVKDGEPVNEAKKKDDKKKPANKPKKQDTNPKKQKNAAEEDLAKLVQNNKDLKKKFNADPKNKEILKQLNDVEKQLNVPLTKTIAEGSVFSKLKINMLTLECKTGDVITVDGKQGIVRNVDGEKVKYLSADDKLLTADVSEISESINEATAKLSIDKRYNNLTEQEMMDLDDAGFKPMFKNKIYYKKFATKEVVLFKRDGKVFITVDDKDPIANVNLQGALTKAKAA